ncbi:MAG: thioredoxin family protein [Pasteurellaceae bacterium]|nr:thioredoxin family protein [Pasteurellaceae bacterium]
MKKSLLMLISTFFLSVQAMAVEFKAFNQAEFESLMQQGKPILVDAYANWCPTCKRQLKVLEPMLKEEAFADLTAFKLDYDTEKQALKEFGISRQSTLILFNQGKEVRRSIAETQADRLRQFITLP